MPRLRLLIALGCSALLGLGRVTFGQTNPSDPSQYPPGQYPPGQYPPGQYPPGQYPPNQYPARLPGGIPINLPVPTIKLPERHPKTDKKDGPAEDMKLTLASAEGTLRKLGEKDLLLETSKDKVLRFRLLAKTRFSDPKGEPVRDSLLHPGDRLSVQASLDDPETAVRVILVRPGTSAERETASAPVPDIKIVMPIADDLKNPHKTKVAQRSNDDGEGSPTESRGGEANDTADTHPELKRSAPGGSSAGGDSFDQVIADAREAAASYNAELPNFLVQQATTRYRSSSGPRNWEPIDVVTADVAVVNGKEDYRNVLVNGRSPQGPVERTGSWSTGEFAITLEDVLNPATEAVFVKRGSDTIAGRDAWVYNMSVLHENSHWIIVAADGRKYAPAYGGAMWVDKETRRVLRIEQRSVYLPSDFTYDKAESVVEYGYVRIDGKPYLLPVTSANSACLSGTGNCVRNEISFRNYRKFTADSDIKYEKFASQ